MQKNGMRNFTVKKVKVGESTMKNFLSFEWKRFWTDIKNKTAFLIVIGLSLYMALGVERTFEPVRSFDTEPIEATYQDAAYFLKTRDPEMYIRSFPVFENLKNLSADLLIALDEQDYRQAILLESEYYAAMSGRFEGENPRYYLYGEDLSNRIRWQNYDENSHFLYSQALLESNLYLTQNILEGKTVGQSLGRAWMGAMPLILLVIALVYSIDFFANDPHHQSLADAYPFSTYKKSWIRTLVVLGNTSLTLLIGEFVFIITLSFFRDWGGIDLWVPEVLNQMTVFSFLLQSHTLFLLAMLILLRIASWSGHLFKNSFLSILLVPLLIFPYLLEIERKTEFVEFFNWIPLSFLQPANVISGFQNFWHNQTRFTFGREFFLLFAILLLIEIFAYFSFKANALKT